jgi:hypothetical protein
MTIARVIVSSYPTVVGLRPVNDSLPWRTWRTLEHDMQVVRPRYLPYPTEGCHGAPLDAPCPRAVFVDVCHTVGCDQCHGTGRVRADHPNRTDMP